MTHLLTRHIKVRFFFLPIICVMSIFFSINASSESQGRIHVIPVSGDVEPGMAAFIKRALEDASKTPEDICILEMDTFGGRVDSALQIVEFILDIPKGKTIAFVKTKAISAGALIALACNEIVMKKNTTIGDCAPIAYSNEGATMLGEKFQSPLRAKFRALAKRNGYNETLAEAMVSSEIEVYQLRTDKETLFMDAREYEELPQDKKDSFISKKTVVAKGELLTMHDEETVELGFARMSVDSLDQMIERMNLQNYPLIRNDENWSERLVRFLVRITPILMMVGLAALYTELKAPGFGFPGIIGILCLGLAFGSQYLVGLANYTELLVILLGILLIGIEVFVLPGFGIAGITGILFVTMGMVLSLQDFVIPDPSFPWEMDLLVKNLSQVLGSFLLAFFIALTVLRYVFPNLPFATKGPYLSKTLKHSRADSIESFGASSGDQGIALTPLRPSGKIKIGQNTFDAITEGDFIEKGTPVAISKISGNKIIVSRKTV